jgi:hypothetical protein
LHVFFYDLDAQQHFSRFEHAKPLLSAAASAVPCPDSLLCVRGGGARETLVAGARQGWAKQRLAANARGWSIVSQQRMAEYFLSTAEMVGWKCTADATADTSAGATAGATADSAGVTADAADASADVSADAAADASVDDRADLSAGATADAADASADGTAAGSLSNASADSAGDAATEDGVAYVQLKAASVEYNEAKRRFKASLPAWPSEEPKRRLAEKIIVNLLQASVKELTG